MWAARCTSRVGRKYPWSTDYVSRDGGVTGETERLILRQPEPADAEALNAAIHASHPELKVWMDWAVEPQTLEETRAYIRTSAEAMDAETAANLLMVDRTSGEIVGSSGYPRLDWSVPSFEIG